MPANEETVNALVTQFDVFLRNIYCEDRVRELLLTTNLLKIGERSDVITEWLLLAHKVLRAEMLGDPVQVSARWNQLVVFEAFYMG